MLTPDMVSNPFAQLPPQVLPGPVASRPLASHSALGRGNTPCFGCIAEGKSFVSQCAKYVAYFVGYANFEYLRKPLDLTHRADEPSWR